VRLAYLVSRIAHRAFSLPGVPRRFVLTGGIGSGKSAAASLFRDLGAEVISADEAGHAVLAPGGEAVAAVAERWPDVVGDAGIDRAALAEIVFADPAELAALEASTHPLIARRVAAAVEASPAEVVMVETPIPSVVAEGWPRIVVDAPEPLRVERLRRRGMSDQDIRGRMSNQPSRGEWLAEADLVVDNSGDLDALRDECGRVWAWITAR
jgi:dephospho-CoA kinase